MTAAPRSALIEALAKLLLADLVRHPLGRDDDPPPVPAAVEARAASRQRWLASREQGRGRPPLVTKAEPAP